MAESTPRACVAFVGTRRLASGTIAEVAIQIKGLLDNGETRPILCFDAVTGEQLDLDTRGSSDEVAARYPSNTNQPTSSFGRPEATTPDEQLRADEPRADGARARGRPRLGVVAREVTLLPRHWDWLANQPGGASVALRKLVEDARRSNAGRDIARRSREAAYRFMSAIAGNLETFEEATRALFAGDHSRFVKMLAPWPADVREQVLLLAKDAFS